MVNSSIPPMVSFVTSMNFPFSSHMSPIDFETLDLIIGQLKNPLDNNHLKNLNEKLFEMIKRIEENEKTKKKEEQEIDIILDYLIKSLSTQINDKNINSYSKSELRNSIFYLCQ